MPQNNEDSIFHIKALIVDESIYLGSANFSKLATTSSAEWGIYHVVQIYAEN